MVDPTLLEILVCPESHQPLRAAPPETLARLAAEIRSGTVVNRGGEPVTVPVDEALIREDGRLLYPVRDEIPIMLIDQAIEIRPDD